MDAVTKSYLLHRLKSRSVVMDNGCIEWRGTKSRQGYGQISVTPEGEKSRLMYTHRAIWMAINDVELGRSIYVCHKCDNPSCINMEHLFVGTAKDNQQDMARKGRAAYQGKKRPPYDGPPQKRRLHTRLCKFDDETIAKVKSDTGSLKEIAVRYGMSEGYVCRLRKGKAKTLIQPVSHTV